MEKEVSLSKTLVKLLLVCIKYLPFIIALCYVLNIVLSYLDIDTIYLSAISHTSLLPLIFMLLCSFVYKFCIYHRLPLYYIFTNNVISSFDYKYHIPITDRLLFSLYLTITFIFIILTVYIYVTRNKETSTKNN